MILLLRLSLPNKSSRKWLTVQSSSLRSMKLNELKKNWWKSLALLKWKELSLSSSTSTNTFKTSWKRSSRFPSLWRESNKSSKKMKRLLKFATNTKP
jgi:hypothetical protein